MSYFDLVVDTGAPFNFENVMFVMLTGVFSAVYSDYALCGNNKCDYIFRLMYYNNVTIVTNIKIFLF